MGLNIQQRGSNFQLRVTHKLLHKPFFATFDSRVEAERAGLQLSAMLASGVVPIELLAGPERGGHDPLVIEIIRGYLKNAPITDSDDALLGVLMNEVVGLRLSSLTFKWVEDWVRSLKVTSNLAPGTIRKRVGALARVVDWHHIRVAEKGAQLPANPLRLMPGGYSFYSKEDTALAAAKGNPAKVDVRRDRRLVPGEEDRIRAVMMGQKVPHKERALRPDPHLLLMFTLIVNTGMRLFECYRLTVEKVDLQRRIIQVDGSKGHRGAAKPRVVPITTELADNLRPFCIDRVGLLFPYWSGADEDRTGCSSRLSQRFASAFDYARADGLTEHDLRHEATCRWVEMRNPGGGWVFGDVEICRIMGWSRMDMMLRYASLRGEDLSSRLA